MRAPHGTRVTCIKGVIIALRDHNGPKLINKTTVLFIFNKYFDIFNVGLLFYAPVMWRDVGHLIS